MNDLPHWLAQAIREEIRGAFMWGVDDKRREVPPHDLDAEASILASQVEMWEDVTLAPDDMFAPVHEVMYEAMLGARSGTASERLGRALRAVSDAGFGQSLFEHAETVLTTTPATAGKPLRELAERVRRIAGLRRTLKAMAEGRAAIYMGKVDIARKALTVALKELDR